MNKSYKITTLMAKAAMYLVRNLNTSLFFLIFLFLITACTGYETGDGELSDMRADYADVVVKQGRVVSIVTDDGVSLDVPPSLMYAEKNDTMLRRLLYYHQGSPIQLLRQVAVGIPAVVSSSDITEMKTDPVTLTASWLSADKRYVNMQLGIKCGSTDGDIQRQVLCLCLDSVSQSDAGAAWFTLYHDQADMPQYYTNDVYLSLPVSELPDIIHLNINTYQGCVQRTFVK